MNDDLYEVVRDGFVRYGRESYGFEAARAALATPHGYRADAWHDYADLGWLALRLPPELGGLGADAAMVGALMETVGRHLMLEPVLASAVLGAGALLEAPEEIRKELSPLLADGSTIIAFAQGAVELADGRLSGEAPMVLHGDSAHRVVVAIHGVGLALIDAADAAVERTPYRLVDGRGAAILRFHGATARMIGDAAALHRLTDQRTVALCAEAFGSADRLVDATAAYLKVRKQFGRTLDGYQALQHRMSELAILREEIAALTKTAQTAIDHGGPDRSRIVAGAAAYILSAARQIANDAVQLHGGIGITDELDISHHFRRQMVIAALMGGRDAEIERFAAATVLAEGACA